MRVAFSATRVALPALIVPFMFVYSPALLLKGTFLDVVACSRAAWIAVDVGGADRLLIGPLRMWERAVALAGGALLVFPGLLSDGIGIALMIVIAITSSRRRRAGLIGGRSPTLRNRMPSNLILTGGHTHRFDVAAPAWPHC